MDIATTLLEYGGKSNAESKAGFTPLHLSAQEGHTDMTSLLIEHQANVDHQAKVNITENIQFCSCYYFIFRILSCFILLNLNIISNKFVLTIIIKKKLVFSS